MYLRGQVLRLLGGGLEEQVCDEVHTPEAHPQEGGHDGEEAEELHAEEHLQATGQSDAGSAGICS
eukprot:3406624-Pyramimonas_sp.AAC.1